MKINTLEELFVLTKGKDFKIAAVTKKSDRYGNEEIHFVYIYLPVGSGGFNGVAFETNSKVVLNYLKIKQI